MAQPPHRKPEHDQTHSEPTPAPAPPTPPGATPEAAAASPVAFPPGAVSIAARDQASSADYRPNRKIHLTAAGPVALGNWVGLVDGKRVRVYRGAQADGIPQSVQKAMAADGVDVGVITPEELGMRQAPGTNTLLR
jgi:hypothetical protein